MWIIYNNTPTMVVGSEEFNLSKVISEGDEICYEGRNRVRRNDHGTKKTRSHPEKCRGVVTAVYTWFCVVRRPSGSIEHVNWFNILGIRNETAPSGTSLVITYMLKALLEEERIRRLNNGIQRIT